MRFRKRHTRNGVTYNAGDPYTGPIRTGRFLYQRGVLEADGGPDDDAITRNPGPRARQRWGFDDDAPQAPPEPAPSLSLGDITVASDLKE
jgi:hypothetical protein